MMCLVRISRKVCSNNSILLLYIISGAFINVHIPLSLLAHTGMHIILINICFIRMHDRESLRIAVLIPTLVRTSC